MGAKVWELRPSTTYVLEENYNNIMLEYLKEAWESALLESTVATCGCTRGGRVCLTKGWWLKDKIEKFMKNNLKLLRVWKMKS